MSQVIHPLQSVAEQTLWIFGSNGPLRPKLIQWLSAYSWQHTHDLSHIKKALLNSEESIVLVDMANSPHRMLAQIRFLHEHFSNSVIISVVESDQNHWGQEALRQGADAYACMDSINSDGLTMLLESLIKQKRQQSLLASVTDTCTGLINSTLFFDRLNHALQVAVRHQCKTGILLVSIEDFSSLVSDHGEVLCEGLLNTVSNQLKTHIRNSDSLSRIREGVFAILLEDLQDEAMIGHIAKKIQSGFEKPIQFQGQSYAIKLSIGGHLCQKGELNGSTLLNQVETALERAKAAGSNRIWFYIPDMNFKAMARQNMQDGLQRALDRDEFYVMFQPSHTAKGFMSNGMVPILRWRHPTAGMVMSDVFMSLLEDSGLILDVSRWQIRTVFQHIRRWIDSGVWKMRQKIFISLCEKQLRSPDFRDFLKNQLEEFKLGADQIILQVTERTTIRNLSLLQALTHELDGLGLCVHLSDFGNQYSSLSYLRQLNVEYLCLDQSFFLHMHLDHLETSIAKVIVDVAHRLGVDVMAIGADSSFKVEKMQALGCDTLVGDHFSAAIYPDEWPEYSKSHS